MGDGGPLTAELVLEVCQGAAQGGPVTTRLDPLSGAIWAQFATADDAVGAVDLLAGFGLAASAVSVGRVVVAGWDPRLLRRRLGVALAGVGDLAAEWSATAELARYHYDRRIALAGEVDPSGAVADVERTMRASAPLPHRAPRSDDIGTLLMLIEKAEDAYQRLIAEHLEHAERALWQHIVSQDSRAGGHGRALLPGGADEDLPPGRTTAPAAGER